MSKPPMSVLFDLMADGRELLVVAAVEAREPLIAAVLAGLEEGRARTKEDVRELEGAALDYSAPGMPNSVGTLLYHLAAIEADWLYCEVLIQDFPEDIRALFHLEVREASGLLSPVIGENPEQHLARLDVVRGRLLDAFREMPLEDFRRPRELPQYDVTPEWVLQHLIQHEASHRGQMRLLKSAYQHSLKRAAS
jgi:uncharacterized damage-inducible protein DinB